MSEAESVTLLRAAEEHDRAGRETDAIALYERAIDLGLPVDEIAGALHGLGSTYRALGRYDEAYRILHHGKQRFPDDASFGPFLAMTLYNLGRPKEAVSLLLDVLLATTSSDEISRYQDAIRLYASDLDRRWGEGQR